MCPSQINFEDISEASVRSETNLLDSPSKLNQDVEIDNISSLESHKSRNNTQNIEWDASEISINQVNIGFPKDFSQAHGKPQFKK